jgi:hypothetical protein
VTDRAAASAPEAGGGRLGLLLAMAMFVFVIDTSLMNVSISAVVQDLDTTVSGVQSAVALEALVSAAFILIGSKLGDLYGRKRAYVVGLVFYASGALAMVFAQGLAAIIVFWAIIGGLGPSLYQLRRLVSTEARNRHRAARDGCQRRARPGRDVPGRAEERVDDRPGGGRVQPVLQRDPRDVCVAEVLRHHQGGDRDPRREIAAQPAAVVAPQGPHHRQHAGDAAVLPILRRSHASQAPRSAGGTCGRAALPWAARPCTDRCGTRPQLKPSPTRAPSP